MEDSDLFHIADKTHEAKIVIVPDDRNDVLLLGERLIKDGYGYSQVTIDEDDVEPVSAGISDMLRDWGFRLLRRRQKTLGFNRRLAERGQQLPFKVKNPIYF